MFLIIPNLLTAQQTPKFQNPTEGTVTSGFGWRNHPKTGVLELHM